MGRSSAEGLGEHLVRLAASYYLGELQ